MGNSRNLANLLGTGSTITTAKIADDAITSAKLADDSVVAAAIATNAVASDALNIVTADLPSGTVLQCKSTYSGTDAVLPNNLTSYGTGASLSITPSSTSSKVLVIAMGAGDIASGYFRALFWQLIRGSSQVIYNQYHMYDSNEQQPNISTQPIVHLDSPASTSAQTYTMRARHQTGSSESGTYNGVVNQHNFSSITLIEISG